MAAPIGDPDEEENGVVLALDVKSKQYHVIYGMGRHNHENNVAIPGFDDLVVLSGDDTFTSGPLTGVPAPPEGTPPISGPVFAQSLYSYIASDTDSLLADEGDSGRSWSTTQPLRRERLQRLLRLRPGSTDS